MNVCNEVCMYLKVKGSSSHASVRCTLTMAGMLHWPCYVWLEACHGCRMGGRGVTGVHLTGVCVGVLENRLVTGTPWP